MISKKGPYWSYYERIGRGKNKKYECLFCEYKLPTYSGICSHLERTHGYRINKIKEEEREEIENKKREEEFIKQQLEEQKEEEIKRKKREKELAKQQTIEFLRNLPQIIKERELEEKQRRIEEEKRIEIWNRIQEANEEREKNEVMRRKRNEIFRLWFLSKLINSEKSWEEKFFLYNIVKQTNFF